MRESVSKVPTAELKTVESVPAETNTEAVERVSDDEEIDQSVVNTEHRGARYIDTLKQKGAELGLPTEKIAHILERARSQFKRVEEQSVTLAEKTKKQLKRAALTGVALTILLQASDRIYKPHESQTGVGSSGQGETLSQWKSRQWHITMDEVHDLVLHSPVEQSFVVLRQHGQEQILQIHAEEADANHVRVAAADIFAKVDEDTESIALGHTHPASRISPPSLQDMTRAIERTAEFAHRPTTYESIVADASGIWKISIDKDSPLVQEVKNYNIQVDALLASMSKEERSVYYRLTTVGPIAEFQIWQLEKSTDPVEFSTAKKLRDFVGQKSTKSFLEGLHGIDRAARYLFLDAGDDQTKHPGTISKRMKNDFTELVNVAKKQGMHITYSGMRKE